MVRFTRATKSMLKGIGLAVLVSASVISPLLYPRFFVNRNNLWKDIDNYTWEDKEVDRLPQEGFAVTHQITQETDTSFGTYIPKNIEYTPAIVPTPIAPDLSNVETIFEMRDWNNESLELIAEQGYLITELPTNSIYYLYETYNGWESDAKYITTDLCLHTYHNLYSMALKFTEGAYLFHDFEILIKKLRDSQLLLLDNSMHEDVQDAILKNIAYLSTLLNLLNQSYTIPAEVYSMTTQELFNINNSAGFAYSPIFGYQEDYSQYKVRGHYTTNQILSNYFQAMMYAGRMGFLFQYEQLNSEMIKEQTRMALLLVSSFNETVDGSQLWEYWERIYSITSFFVGESDDLTILDYYKIWKHYGYPELNDIADDAFISKVIEDLKSAPLPKILSMLVTSSSETSIPRGLRLFGQAFIPDSYIFQELVHDKVPLRIMPDPLDIFSVFGSERASYLLQNETDIYPEYELQVNQLRDEFSSLTDYDWCQSLYWLQLYSLLPLLQENYTGYPGYMKKDSWKDKSLLTALGSWTQLRHDTLLYGKQGYTALGLHGGFGYVEPYPELYARLSSTIQMMNDGLKARGLLIEDFENRLNITMGIFDRLTEISIKELEDEELTIDDIDYIDNVGNTMNVLTSFSSPIYSEWIRENDGRDALIADVHTDPNTGTALEVAIGNPLSIFAIVQDHLGNLRVVHGGMYSYYEFTVPIHSRLTDEEWRDIVDTDPPDMPDWILDGLPYLDFDQLSYEMLNPKCYIKIRKKI